MSRIPHPSAAPLGEIRLDRLLGRDVLTARGQRAGRLEEFRAEKTNGEYTVTEYVIGAAGLFERLGVGVKMLFGRRPGGYVASWDQIDFTDPDRPRLTCPLEKLRKR
jgi:hypothetical protein